MTLLYDGPSLARNGKAPRSNPYPKVRFYAIIRRFFGIFDTLLSLVSMSNPHLHLTTNEQAILAVIPENLRKKVNIETETLMYADTPQRMQIRVKNMQLSAPGLLVFKKKVTEATTVEEVTGLLSTANLTALSEDDLSELYFAMGPDGVSTLIVQMLPHVRSEEDLEALISLCVIRHSLLLSLSPTAASL